MNTRHVNPLILVLDAEQRSALATVRSLGRQGLRVMAAGVTEHALAGSSRFCTQYHRCPDPAAAPEDFLAWLASTVADAGVTFLLPVTEVSSQLVLKHRAVLPAGCVMPFTDLQTLMQLSHKGKLVRLASRMGVPCPDTRFFENASELDPASVTTFPVVLKPCLSRIDLGARWLNTAVLIVRNREELTSALGSRAEFRSHPFMLQSFIPGTGAGVFALYDHGREVATFAHRRLREKPPAGGVSVLSESAEPPPAALAAARKLLSTVKWHGVAMVEVRVAHDGTPYLMEVNTRLWGSLQLAIDAGMDFPWLLYQVANGRDPVVPESYRVGKRLRWWLGDLDSLYLFLRDRRNRLPAKLRRVVQFLTPDPCRTSHEVFRWSDPMPAWRELRNWISMLRN